MIRYMDKYEYEMPGKWIVWPEPYVGDADLIWLGICLVCQKEFGKSFSEASAQKRLQDHWDAKHE